MVAQICALHEKWDAAKYAFRADPASMYEPWLKQRAADARSVFLVAERQMSDGGRLAGFIVGTVEREVGIYRLKEYGFLHDLWVEPAYRHEGIGRQLAMMAVERFTQMGVKQVRLDTAGPNEAARRLFESCGFRTSAVEMLIELERVDEG